MRAKTSVLSADATSAEILVTIPADPPIELVYRCERDPRRRAIAAGRVAHRSGRSTTLGPLYKRTACAAALRAMDRAADGKTLADVFAENAS